MGTNTEESAPRPEEQLDAIRSMLSAGHHSITLEPHSFALWGLCCALALQALPRVFTPERFPSSLVLAALESLAATALFGGTAWLDVSLSVRAKRSRDEIYSWTQRQLGKLTLLFAALALVALTYAGILLVFAHDLVATRGAADLVVGPPLAPVLRRVLEELIHRGHFGHRGLLGRQSDRSGN